MPESLVRLQVDLGFYSPGPPLCLLEGLRALGGASCLPCPPQNPPTLGPVRTAPLTLKRPRRSRGRHPNFPAVESPAVYSGLGRSEKEGKEIHIGSKASSQCVFGLA